MAGTYALGGTSLGSFEEEGTGLLDAISVGCSDMAVEADADHWVEVEVSAAAWGTAGVGTEYFKSASEEML